MKRKILLAGGIASDIVTSTIEKIERETGAVVIVNPKEVKEEHRYLKFDDVKRYPIHNYEILENINSIHLGEATRKQREEKVLPVREGLKLGRNNVCLCGSGKKYKNC